MISFVVQGPTCPTTQETCKSIRRHFHGSEIILSTWPDASFADLDCDKIIVSRDDPGPTRSRSATNVCRQITTALAGVRLASFDIVAKVRTDTVFINNEILSYWDRYGHFVDELRIFKKKVLIPTVGSMNPLTYTRPFHPADFFTFGLKEDLLVWYDIPNDASKVVKEIAPEQYIALNALQKFYPEVDIKHMNDINEENRRQSAVFFANNFVVLDNALQFGAYAEKYQRLCTCDEEQFDDWCRYWFDKYVRYSHWIEMYASIGGQI